MVPRARVKAGAAGRTHATGARATPTAPSTRIRAMDHDGAADGPGALPDLVLYSRPGCHLCEDARVLLVALLAARTAAGNPAPALVERDITTSQDWERAYFLTIPVVELGDHRVELATSAMKLRALLATLDVPTPASA